MYLRFDEFKGSYFNTLCLCLFLAFDFNNSEKGCKIHSRSMILTSYRRRFNHTNLTRQMETSKIAEQIDDRMLNI